MTAFATSGSVNGRRVLGRYELLLPIASGGMATVWAARLRGSRGFQKIVAVKTIRAEMAEDAEFGDMLLDEASLASRIRHPHVVEILDLGDHEGVPYIVMEWIDGEPLHVLIKDALASDAGAVPLPICVRIGTQLCAGLHAAHELCDDNGKLVGLVHRDVSPQNVLVTWEGVAKLVDFGIAKAAGRAVGQTVAGRIKGKTAYLAPEQVLGEPVDRRTDVFATGTLMYAMTTGKHPFRGISDVDTLGNVLSDKPPPRPGKIVAGYPPQLEKVIMTALEKDPVRRYQTASEMLRDLDRALPANRRISTDEEVARFVRTSLGPRFEDTRAKIKEALRLADERIADDARKSFTSESNEGLLPDKPSPTGVRVVDHRRKPGASAARAQVDRPPGDADSAGSGIVSKTIPRNSRETVPAGPRARAASVGSFDETLVPPAPAVPKLSPEPEPTPEPVSAPSQQKPAPQPVSTETDPGTPAGLVVSNPGTRRPLMFGILAAVLLAGLAMIILLRRSSSPSADLDRGPAASISAAVQIPSAPTASTTPAQPSTPEPARSDTGAQASASAVPAPPAVVAAPRPTPVTTAPAPGKPKPKPFKPTTI